MTRLLLAALVAFLAPDALAQTCTTSWTNAAGGPWEDAANWDAGVPDASDTACITLAGTYTVATTTTSSRSVAGVVLGGGSGTQTLTTQVAFTVGGNGTVRPSGRWEMLDRVNNGTDGLSVGGTLLVEGTLVQNGGTQLLTSGGTLDVAPGGTYRLLGSADAGGAASTVRVRGLVEGAGCASDCQLRAALTVEGGTLRALVGALSLRRAGTFHDAVLDAAAGATLSLGDADVSGGGLLTVTGTISGAPAGDVVVTTLATFAAGPGGATLAVGGTGLRVTSSTGSSYTDVTSRGGQFVNTGLLVWGDDLNRLTGVRLTNRGVVRLAGSMNLLSGAVLRNEPGATVEVIRGVRGTGRLENAGLLHRMGAAGNTSFGGLLRSLPGSEIRSDVDRLDIDGPGAQTVPDGVTLTGTGRFGIPRALDIQGTVSPGTEAVPLARLTFESAFLPSQVLGSPQLVIDVDAGGRSDTLDVLFSSGSLNIRLAGALVVRVRPGYVPAVGDQFTVLLSGQNITGQFSQVVAQGAPAGIAFVAEPSADLNSLVVRAVETAPGGAITVSTTRPVGGGVRSLFFTGPGVTGISAARLQCTTCLDPDSLGVIPAQLVGAGTLREARFDLTSPRAFGLYDLVIERPGQPDEVVPVTVRPFLSYIQTAPSVSHGIRVRPPGGGFNFGVYRLFNTSNAPEPAYPFAVTGPEDEGTVAFRLYAVNPFSGGSHFYNSETAANPAAPATVFARIPANGNVPLTYGLRVDPSAVLFPEQTPTGPDDPRLPFGQPRFFSAVAVQHVSFARARDAIDAALRNTHNDPLTAYVAQVDAAASGAVRAAVEGALRSQPLYVGGVADLLRRVLEGMHAAVPTPAGLDAAATFDFGRTLDVAIYRLYAEVEYAYHLDLPAAPQAVRDVLAAEYQALLDASAGTSRGLTIGSVCRDLSQVLQGTGTSASVPRRLPPPPTEIDINSVIQCQLQEEASPPPPSEIDITALPPPTSLSLFGTMLNESNSQMREAIYDLGEIVPAPFGPGGGICDPGGGGGGGGGAGGGGSCTPPRAPADPNDKTTEPSLLCELGTVVVGGEPQTRCVRHFIPLVEADAPIPYTIQFENLPAATANAEFVTITDTLDVALDPTTLEVYAASADSTFSYTVEGQVVTFRWVGLDLPPNVTAPEGEGYVSFGVTPDAGLPTGTVIMNDASIVFDFNPPIATPPVIHEIRQAADVATVVTAPDFVEEGQPFAFDVVVANVQGDPADDLALTITTGGAPIASVTPTAGACTGSGPVTCTLGSLSEGTFAHVTVVLASPPIGEYTLASSVTTSAFDAFLPNNSDAVTAGVTPVGTEDDGGLPRELTLSAPWPNPTRGDVRFLVGLPAAGAVDVRVYDLLGREVARLAEGEPGEAGWHETEWDAGSLASGVYVVRLTVGDETRTRRITVLR